VSGRRLGICDPDLKEDNLYITSIKYYILGFKFYVHTSYHSYPSLWPVSCLFENGGFLTQPNNCALQHNETAIKHILRQYFHSSCARMIAQRCLSVNAYEHD